jgi:hypothetical protein
MDLKRIISIFLIILLLQTIAVSAISVSDAKSDWLDKKEDSAEAKKEYQLAKVEWVVDKTDENNQKVIDSGKETLSAALDEAEAWLIWKNLEAEEDSRVPDYIKENIAEDVQINLVKITELRSDVDGIDNQLELGLVFLKMIGKYAELLTDVARNTGSMWISIGENYADKVEEYSELLREKAGNNKDVLAKLDLADEELETAKDNIEKAKETYQEVRLPGTPLIKFDEGNSYLRAAKNNLINANRHLTAAYGLLLGGSRE